MAVVTRPRNAVSNMCRSVDYADIVREFEWTRPRHGGVVRWAAPILGLSVVGLDQILVRARARGIAVEFTRTEQTP